jgi:hypothetical protein
MAQALVNAQHQVNLATNKEKKKKNIWQHNGYKKFCCTDKLQHGMTNKSSHVPEMLPRTE